VKLTLTDPISVLVTETFVGAFGVLADAEVANTVTEAAANMITLAESANGFLN